MKYLNKKSGLTAHYWDQDKQDTFCRMWSTGGISKHGGYEISDKNTCAKICTNCQHVMGNKMAAKQVREINPISDIEQYKLTRSRARRDKAANSKMKRTLNPR